MQNDGADEASTDKADAFRQCAKLFFHLGHGGANYFHKKQHNKHCLAKGCDSDVD